MLYSRCQSQPAPWSNPKRQYDPMDRIERFGVKQNDGERLVWWKRRADETYWHEQFRPILDDLPGYVRSQANSPMLHTIQRFMPKNGRILEAGCGSGWVVEALRQRGYTVEGVDYSADLIALVNQKYPDVPVRFGDVTRLAVPDNHYAGYISLGVIEHRREGTDPFIAEAARVTQPGGTLFFSVPYYSPLRKLRYRGRRTMPEDGALEFYQYGFDKLTVRGLFADSGLDFVAFASYGVRRGIEEDAPALYRLVSSRWLRPTFERADVGGFDWTAHMLAIILRKPLKGDSRS